MRIVFWGTPAFAVPALAALLGEGADVVGVVTQPDKPVGRQRTLTPPPVKVLALDEGLPVLQPLKPRGEAFMAELAALAPDLNVVVAYGHLLPQAVIDLPRFGTINIHASLLPRWRGAAPIEAAILAGDAETGVCIMRMVLALDAGDVLLERRTPIFADEAGGELTQRLSELGAQALLEVLPSIEQGTVVAVPQPAEGITYAGKLTREAARIDWTQDAAQVARAIRAYDPRPGAWTTHRGEDVKCYGGRLEQDAHGDAGLVLDVSEHGMLVACGRGGAVRIGYVHPAGKRRLAALDWKQGRGVAVGDVLA
ncbi:MAG: methionyl-tRNA formyltransferase [Gemmatimonadaceae bacterium]|jgi:methionyl-tRNA formyltransferase|nr:methionyl-tRNA formyltransferase [Gemmatimonadaceae bacterium]